MDNILIRRFEELSQRAFDKNYITETGFLNLDEISTLKSLHLPSPVSLLGGYPQAERCIACFGDITEDYLPPLACVKIEPLNAKFSDKLTHRDFLGALINLGIERSVLGDIIVKDNTAWLFCLKSISGYITDSLSRVKHTSVKCEIIVEIPAFLITQPEGKEYNVSSLRADAVTAAVYQLSRSSTADLFRQGKIFINARLCEKEGTLLKEGDTVSVRGHGKYIFDTTVRTTKKDRLIVSLKVYQ